MARAWPPEGRSYGWLQVGGGRRGQQQNVGGVGGWRGRRLGWEVIRKKS